MDWTKAMMTELKQSASPSSGKETETAGIESSTVARTMSPYVDGMVSATEPQSCVLGWGVICCGGMCCDVM